MEDHLAVIAKTAQTYAINTASSGDQTIRTIDASRRFVVYHLYVEAENAVDLTFKSGSTAISGAVVFGDAEEKEWKNGGVPVFVGRALGDNFVINLSADAKQINGFAVIGELHV